MSYKKTNIILIGILFITIFGFSYGLCKEIQPPSDAQIIDLSKMTTENLKEILDNKQTTSGKIILLAPQGYEMNLSIKFDGSVISTENSTVQPLKVKFKKTVYFYPVKGEPLFSLDGKKWGKGTEFFSGNIAFTCSVEEAASLKNPIFNLIQEINLKAANK
jgi:hypothetical protein